MKILYIHGYLGQADGSASRLLRDSLKEHGIEAVVDAPQFEVINPEETLDKINSLQPEYDLIVASSLGAFYALQTSGTNKILVNIAFPKDLAKLIDDSSFISKLDNQLTRFFDLYYDTQSVDEATFLFGTEDTIANNSDIINKYFSDIHYVKMEHKLNKVGADCICNLIGD